jgi:hypothetical protein
VLITLEVQELLIKVGQVVVLVLLRLVVVVGHQRLAAPVMVAQVLLHP